MSLPVFFGWISQAFKAITLYIITSICQIETELVFPSNYAFLFICSVSTAFLSFISFLGIREPIHPVNASRQPLWQHLKQGPHFLRTDKNYRRFIFFRIGTHFSAMASPFYVPYALDYLGVSEATIGFFHCLFSIKWSGFKCYLGVYWGKIWRTVVVDYHCGSYVISAYHRVLFRDVTFCIFLYPAFLLIFTIGGVLANGVMVGFMSYMLNIAPPRSRPSYIGFMNTLLLPTSFAPVLGGLLVSLIGHRMLFVICFGICLVAFGIGTGTTGNHARR